MRNKPLTETVILPFPHCLTSRLNFCGRASRKQNLCLNKRVVFFQWPLPCLSLCFIACLLIPQIASAAFWIDSYSGSSEDYRLVRQEKEFTVEAQTLLNAGDELSVLSDTGKLLIVEEGKVKMISLSQQNPTFKVPESKVPPGIMSNMVALGGQWITQILTEEVETSVMSTRGDGPVLLSGASDLENQLIEGIDSLVIYWTGGKPPYQIHLLDKDDKVIVEKINIQENRITLTGLNIPVGDYGLEVLGESSSSYIALVVVDKDKVPAVYHKIFNSLVPDKVKHSYATLVLASRSEWLFQALQLAEGYGLEKLKQNILHRDVPDAIDASRF